MFGLGNSLLEKKMNVYRFFLAGFILGILASIGLFVGGIILILNLDQMAAGIILLVIGFIFVPFCGRLFVRYLQARNAYKRVKRLKKNNNTEMLLKMTRIETVKPTRIEQLRMLFSVYALIDLKVKEVAPILVSQYQTAQQHNYRPKQYYRLIKTLADKFDYESPQQLIDEYS
jgi:hypothetical protein